MALSNGPVLGIALGFFLLSSAALVISSIEKSDLINLDAKIVYAMLGKSVNILAKASEGRSIQFCRWDAVNNSKVGSSGVVFVNEENIMPPFPSVSSLQSPKREVPGYRSYGMGLTNGQCGITIENVTQEDLTVWKYVMIEFNKKEGNPVAVTREVKLEQPVKPTPPVIIEKDLLQNIIERNASLPGGKHPFYTVSCCSQNGVPHPQLRFEMNDGELVTSVSEVSTAIAQFCIRWEEATFSREDNGKVLKCISEHVTTLASDKSETQDSVIVNVEYPPKLLTLLTYPNNQTILTQFPTELDDKSIHIRYSAYPSPEISWYRQDTSSSGDFIEITVNDKEYSSSTRNTGNYIFEASLSLNTEEALNLNNLFKIVACNKAGTMETFILTSTKTSKNPISEDRLISYWILVPLIVLIVLIILGIVVTLLARHRGWFCYEKRTGKYKTRKQSNGVYDSVHTSPDP